MGVLYYCREQEEGEVESIHTDVLRPRRLRRPRALSLLLSALAALSACAGPPGFNGQVLDPPREAPDFSGLNWNGQPFRLSDHRGEVAILSFGYTYCPDVCPMTFWKMKDLYARLGEKSSEVAFVFVSVDPKRDTPEKLAEYVSAFDPRFYGVHLDDEALETTIEAYGVTVRHVPLQNPVNLDGSYNVDHTATYFVLDRRGRIRLQFPPKATVDELLPDLSALITEG